MRKQRWARRRKLWCTGRVPSRAWLLGRSRGNNWARDRFRGLFPGSTSSSWSSWGRVSNRMVGRKGIGAKGRGMRVQRKIDRGLNVTLNIRHAGKVESAYAEDRRCRNRRKEEEKKGREEEDAFAVCRLRSMQALFGCWFLVWTADYRRTSPFAIRNTQYAIRTSRFGTWTSGLVSLVSSITYYHYHVLPIITATTTIITENTFYHSASCTR